MNIKYCILMNNSVISMLLALPVTNMASSVVTNRVYTVLLVLSPCVCVSKMTVITVIPRIFKIDLVSLLSLLHNSTTYKAQAQLHCHLFHRALPDYSCCLLLFLSVKHQHWLGFKSSTSFSSICLPPGGVVRVHIWTPRVWR